MGAREVAPEAGQLGIAAWRRWPPRRRPRPTAGSRPAPGRSRSRGGAGALAPPIAAPGRVAPGGERGGQRARLGRDQLDAATQRQPPAPPRRDGIEDEDGRLDAGRAQGDGLVERGDAEQAGAAGQEGPGGDLQAVPVAVGLDDRRDARPGPASRRMTATLPTARPGRSRARRGAAAAAGRPPPGAPRCRSGGRRLDSPAESARQRLLDGLARRPRSRGDGRSWLARRPAPGGAARGRSRRAGRRRRRRRRRIARGRPRRRRRGGRRPRVPRRPAGSPGRAGRRWCRPARRPCRPWPGPGSRGRHGHAPDRARRRR